MTIRNRHRHPGGFTFIEALLALAAFMIVAVSLYHSFAAGMQLDQRSRDANRSYREVRWIMDQITRDLENSMPYDFSGSYADKKSFEGRPSAMTVMVHTDQGLRFIRYSARDGVLYRREMSLADFLQPDPSAQPTTAEILTRSLARNGLQFLYYTGTHKRDHWQATWDGPDLPPGVHVDLTFAPPQPGQPPLAFRRDITVPAGLPPAKTQSEKAP